MASKPNSGTIIIFYYITYGSKFLNCRSISIQFYDLEKKNQLVDIGRCYGNCRRNDGTSPMVRFLSENSTIHVVFSRHEILNEFLM